MAGTRFHTRTLTGILRLSASDNVVQASLIVRSGTVTVTGNMPLQQTDSSATTLSAGQSTTLTGTNGSSPLDGITIDATGGSCDLQCAF